jgi:RNA polymerase sigma-70 factor, ECF subfamily
MMGEMADHLMAGAGTDTMLREFGPWMVSEQKRIFLLCRRMLDDPEDADSATQDTFLKAYQALKRDGAPPIEDASKWVTRIAVNTCMDRLRSRKWQFWRKRPNADDESTILDLTQETRPSAEDQMLAREIRKRLMDALSRLSARQRAVFTLRHFEGRSLEEIGEVLAIPTGTVKAHMFRAVNKLREELKDLYGRPALD